MAVIKADITYTLEKFKCQYSSSSTGSFSHCIVCGTMKKEGS